MALGQRCFLCLRPGHNYTSCKLNADFDGVSGDRDARKYKRRIYAGRCRICGEPAATRNGRALTLCENHRRLRNADQAARRMRTRVQC